MLTDHLVSSPACIQTTPASDHRVFFALSAEENALFFPDGIDSLHYESASRRSSEVSPKELAQTLVKFNPQVLVTSWSTPPLTKEMLKDLSALRYVCHTTGSVRQLIPRAFLERGILVTNWGTITAKAVAEHALLLILAGLRRLPEWPPVIAGKRPWHPSPIQTRTLFGKRVGLHGFGNVAQTLVSLLRPFGVKVSAYSEGVPPEIFSDRDVARQESLEELFASNDIIVECEALNPSTRGSVTRAILDRILNGALFVNVGRGAVVDEHALAELAQSGKLRLALDVYAADPIAKDSPLHQVEAAILSPHIAGPTSDQFAHCGAQALQNLEAFYNGHALKGQVTLEMYDRAT